MISAECVTGYASCRCREEQISTNREEIARRLKLTDEMRLVCLFEDSFPSDYTDTKPFLLPLKMPSSCIAKEDLVKLRTSLESVRKILNFFQNSQKDLYPNLRRMTEGISYFPEISRRIDVILDKFGEVKDNASPDLQTIRRSIRDKEGSVSRRMMAILKQAQADGIVGEDAMISIHGGRGLIPVSSADKKKIPGLVLDESASGKTSFIEPMEVVELNNKVRELHFEEQREILRILAEFSDFLRPYLPELIECSDYMGEMDFLNAKAKVGIGMKASLPTVNDEGRIVLRQARHPLLEKTLEREDKQIVPLDLQLSREKHILVISGPNAGGKSVCLKTVGLLQYMFQWGLLIPTSEISEMTVFDGMFVDIGDDQSIENDLSTYSSHLVNMKDIVEHCTSSSLVLIDEFGSGTEPAAGGAIAESVLREIDRIGAYAVITTHYTNLKLYANSADGAVNGAMQFDVKNIKPLFKLEIGLPGNSFAFELARKTGLSEPIVKQAEELAGADFVSIERQLRKINRNRRALDEKLARIRTTDKTLEGIIDKYQKELDGIKATKKQILDDARSEAADILKEANRKVEATIKEIRESQADKERTREIRKDLGDFSKKIESDTSDEIDRQIEAKMTQIVERKKREAERKKKRAGAAVRAAGRQSECEPGPVPVSATPDDSPLSPGDKVRVKESDLAGEITMVSGKKVYIAIGSMISIMKTDNVERISNNEFKEAHRNDAPVRSNFDNYALNERRMNFRPEIDIRGMRLNEALPAVQSFMDDALVIGIGKVRILHGKGTGVLREDVRKYVITIPGVAKVEDESYEQGGAGVTVVTFTE
ncbi:MAG: Smr/MutS family protein [Bacteroidales bacterium]|nr:Smr/MutS family protein [Bacteroidales bacterium]